MQVILLRLAEFLQAPRELLREDLNATLAHEKAVEDKIETETSLLDRVRAKKKEDDDIDVHLGLRDPKQRDDPENNKKGSKAPSNNGDLEIIPSAEELATGTIVEEGKCFDEAVEEEVPGQKLKEEEEEEKGFYEKLEDLEDTSGAITAPSNSAKGLVCKHCGEDPGLSAEALPLSSRPATSNLLRLLSGDIEEEDEKADEEDQWERDKDGNLLLDENGNLIPKTIKPLPTRRQLAERLK